MDIWGIVIRLIVVSSISVILSFMAVLTVKWIGTNLKDIKQRNSPKVLTIAAIFNLLFILAVSLVLRFWDNRPIQVLGFNLDTSGWILSLLVLIISTTFGIIFVWFLHLKGILRIKRFTFSPGNNQNLFITLFGFLVLFLAALQEEILFRGYFGFILIPQGFWYGIIISSVVFTLWHFITNKAGFFQMIDWFLGGIMLFYLYWLSGSIWVVTIIHFTRNLTNVVIFNISGSNSIFAFEKAIKPAHKTVYTILYSFLIMLIGYSYYGPF